jgi:site-specific DNA recombinase
MTPSMVLQAALPGLADAAEVTRRACRAGARPDPKLRISEWADQHRVLSTRSSPEPGLAMMQPKPLRCAIYARVSPKPEGAVGDNYSIAAQLHEMKALALRDFGCAKPDEYIDKNVSGATLNRPQLDRLRDNIALRLYDVIIAYSPDRWSRLKMIQQVILDEEIERGGARMAFVSGSYEDSPEGRLARNMQRNVSEYEREKFRERSARCRRQKSREGYAHAGPAPDGYRYEGHAFSKKGEYVIDRERARIVKMIFERTAQGSTNSRLALWLNEQGILTQKGHGWYRESVAQILEKTAYCGEVIQNGETIKVPAIVTRDLWDRAHAALARNKVGRVGRPPRQYLLSGLLWCARCGKRCATHPRRGDEAAYRCNNVDNLNRAIRRCFAPEIRKHLLEAAVWDAVWDTVCDPGLLWEMIEAYYGRVAANKGKAKDPGVAEINRERRRLERAEKILKDPDSPVPYEQAKADLDKARRDLATAESARGLAPVIVMPERKNVEAASERFRKMRRALEAFEDRREALCLLVEKILYADREAEIHCHLPAPKAARNCNRHVGANPQSQRKNREGAEARVCPHRAQAVADVEQELLK